MNSSVQNQAIPALRWTLGIVLLIQSLRFALLDSSTPQIHAMPKGALPAQLPSLLGGSEALAAFLFLLPVTTKFGGYALALIFAGGILIHVAHGDFEVGALIVYAAAVLACVVDSRRAEPEGSHAG